MKSWPLFVFIALLAPPLSRAQAFGINCDNLQAPSQGCKSYNEMIMNRDKELIGFIGNESDVYVCFRPNEDVFLFLGFRAPEEVKFKTGASGYPEASGQSIYFRYSDGVLDDSKIVNGIWKRFMPKDGPLFFTKEGNTAQSSISDSEFSIAYSFTNLSHKTTNYTVTIRRSTLRFYEQYTFPEIPVAAKNGANPATDGTDNRFSYSGYCAQIKSSAPIDLRTAQ